MHYFSLASFVSCTLSVSDLVDALIEAGADPNCRNTFDWGPLLVSESWLGYRPHFSWICGQKVGW